MKFKDLNPGQVFRYENKIYIALDGEVTYVDEVGSGFTYNAYCVTDATLESFSDEDLSLT